MELRKLTDKIFYYPHHPDTDRPMLPYIKGEKIALAIDAGNSANHVNEFYEALKAEGLKKPDMTVITHWHWDHTFGMPCINGLSAAHKKTNEFLNLERAKMVDNSYIDFLKKDDAYFGREYADTQSIAVVPSDIQFEKHLTINLGGITASIFHTISPHSEDTVLIYVPEEKVLFLGDATSEDFYNDGYMNKDKLRILTNTIAHVDCQYCMLSHTAPLIKADLLSYLKTIL